jgi:hypothetical protein
VIAAAPTIYASEVSPRPYFSFFGTIVKNKPILRLYAKRAASRTCSPRFEGIYLGPVIPCWVNDDILKPLVDSYDIKLVSTPDADIQAMLRKDWREHAHVERNRSTTRAHPKRFRGAAPT